MPELHSKPLTLTLPAQFCVAHPAKLTQLERELVWANAPQQEEGCACLSLHPKLYVPWKETSAFEHSCEEMSHQLWQAHRSKEGRWGSWWGSWQGSRRGCWDCCRAQYAYLERLFWQGRLSTEGRGVLRCQQ